MENVKTFVSSEYTQEVNEVMNFLNDLSQDEKKGFLMFIQGMKAAKSIKDTRTA